MRQFVLDRNWTEGLIFFYIYLIYMADEEKYNEEDGPEDVHHNQRIAEDPEMERDGDTASSDQPGVFEAFGPKVNLAEEAEDLSGIIEECRKKANEVSPALSGDERESLEYILSKVEDNFSYQRLEPWRFFAEKLALDVLDEYKAGKKDLAADNLFDLRQELEDISK